MGEKKGNTESSVTLSSLSQTVGYRPNYPGIATCEIGLPATENPATTITIRFDIWPMDYQKSVNDHQTNDNGCSGLLVAGGPTSHISRIAEKLL